MTKDTMEAIRRYLGAAYKGGGVVTVREYALRILEWCDLKQYMLSDWDDHRLATDADGRSVLQVGIEWLSSFEKPWLLFVGANGLGKTMLAGILAKLYTTKTQKEARVLNWVYFLKGQHRKIDLSKQGRRIPDDLIEEDIYRYIGVPFLVVDDLTSGKIGASTWALEMLFDLMEMRKGPTLFTANMGLLTQSGKSSAYYLALMKHNATLKEAERGTHRDLVLKVTDRLSHGKGGKVYMQVGFDKAPSYRQEKS